MTSKVANAKGGVFFRPSALWTPEYLAHSSAWFEHGPFAFWLTDVLRPRCFVELGTHAGYSYFCFCQAVQRLHLGTSCYAVDTWTGDEHSGLYGEDVFCAVTKHNQLYTSFSTLIRSTFDDALSYFPDKSIDLLHIDGRHFYEDVCHDFESWRGKLTEDAIILFHDTNVRERQFGVWKLFEELKQDHATFEFMHGHGLGVVALNKIPPILKSLFAMDAAATNEWRQAFAILGNSVTQKWQAKLVQAQLQEQVANHEQENLKAQLIQTQLQEQVARHEQEKLQAQLVQLQLQEQVASHEQEKLQAQRVQMQLQEQMGNLIQENERAPKVGEKNAILSELLSLNHKMQQRRSWLEKAWLRLQIYFLPSKAKLNAVRTSIFFDADWYLATYPDVASSNTDPAQHYLEFGAREGRDPGPLFSTRLYFSNHPDIARAQLNPLVHILNFGFSNSQKKELEESHNGNRGTPGQACSFFGYIASDFVPVPLLQGKPPIKSGVRLVAFYLPQFHQIAENDEWWGRGFTEWTNVTRAVPQFEGHYQPHLPGELGFYDLRNTAVQKRQSELARLYGISAFCIYFYWFNGHILLERPLLNIIENMDIEQDFCLCWANENWSRRWDGLDQELLIKQNYSADDDIAFIEYISKYLKDRRYLRINGKPVLIIYRPQLLPSMQETAGRWRTWCRDNGVGEIYLVCTHSFGQIDPKEYGCDAAVEFPPNQAQTNDIKSSKVLLNPNYDGHIYDWSVFVERSKSYAMPEYRLFRTVCPMWDNEARKSGKGNVFVNSSPARYGEWLLNAVIDTTRGIEKEEERLIFINAWNEWAEGAHLEPDRRHGYAYLEATRVALARARITNNAPKLSTKTAKVAIIVHAFYMDVFVEILDYLGEIDPLHHVFVTTISNQENEVRSILTARNIDHTIFVYENRGRDVFPFLQTLKQIDSLTYPFVLKLHTKKSTHRDDGDKWCREHLESLATPKQLAWILKQLCKNTNIGLVGAASHVIPIKFYLSSNIARFQWLVNRMGMSVADVSDAKFIAGTMWVARRDALEPLLNLALDSDDFEFEAGQVDGTMAHAIERASTYSAMSVDLDIASIAPGDADFKVPLNHEMTIDYKFAKAT